MQSKQVQLTIPKSFFEPFLLYKMVCDRYENLMHINKLNNT